MQETGEPSPGLSRFSIPLEIEFGEAVAGLYSYTHQMAVVTDFEQLAEEWIQRLQLHADEG